MKNYLYAVFTAIILLFTALNAETSTIHDALQALEELIEQDHKIDNVTIAYAVAELKAYIESDTTLDQQARAQFMQKIADFEEYINPAIKAPRFGAPEIQTALNLNPQYLDPRDVELRTLLLTHALEFTGNITVSQPVISIEAPTDVATPFTLILPNNTGLPTQVLTTDGNNPAQLYWSTISATATTSTILSGTSCDIPLTVVSRDGTGSFAATTITLSGNSLINHSSVGGCDIGSGFVWAPTHQNTVIGLGAGNDNALTGGSNTILGYAAGQNIGTGSDNIYLGAGATGLSNEGDTIRIGTQGVQQQTFIAGIYDVMPAPPVYPVVVTSNGQLGIGSASPILTGSNCDIPLTLVLRDSTGSFAATTITLTGNSLINYSFNGGCDLGQGFVWAPTHQNTIIGLGAGNNNALTGGDNAALGYHALSNITTGTNNIALGVLNGSGAGSGYTSNESYNIVLGNVGTTGDQNVIRIGTEGTQTTAYMAGIFGNSLPSGSPVVVLSTGQLGIGSSIIPTSTTLTGTSCDIPLTLVLRDSTGSFAATTITLTGNSLINYSSLGGCDIGQGFVWAPTNQNTIIGLNAGNSNMLTGTSNVVLGFDALMNATVAFDTIAIGLNAAAALQGGFEFTYTDTSGTLINAIGGSENVALGTNALAATQQGFGNVALGSGALSNAVDDDYPLQFNVAVGYQALANTSGSSSVNINTAVGSFALASNISGLANTALGNMALATNSMGSDNIAIGDSAMAQAQASNDIAIGNNALGSDAGSGNNIAIGVNAMNGASPTIGNDIAIGNDALSSDTENGNNIAIGFRAMRAASPIHGDDIAIGNNALSQDAGGNNIAVGSGTLSRLNDGTHNVAIGMVSSSGAGFNYRGSESNNILLSNLGTLGESNTIHIGTEGTQTTAYMAGIYGNSLPSGSPVVVLSTGQLGIGSSIIPTSTTLTGTSCDIPLTLVLRDSTGNFAATTITLTGNSLINYSSVGGCDIGQGFVWAPTYQNTVIGLHAGNSNTLTGENNTALGYYALAASSLETGNSNIAIGNFALSGESKIELPLGNIALGVGAMTVANPVQNGDIAIGAGALAQDVGGYNIGIGAGALSIVMTGTNNIALGVLDGSGAGSGYTSNESYNIAIGNTGQSGDQGVIRIGTQDVQQQTFIAGIYDVIPTPPTYPVVITGDGQLGVGSASPILSGTSCDQALTLVLRDSTGSFAATTITLTGNSLINYSDFGDCDTGAGFVWAPTNQNTIIGLNAGNNNTLTGTNNTALGYYALAASTLESGNGNIAIGNFALSGESKIELPLGNIALGVGAMMVANPVQNGDIAIGAGVLAQDVGGYNIGIGAGALGSVTTGTNNIAIGVLDGAGAGSGYANNESYNIAIGNIGQSGDQGVIRIGTQDVQTTAYMAGIYDNLVSPGFPVVVGMDGQLGIGSTIPTGTGTSCDTPFALVLRDTTGSFAATTITLTGNSLINYSSVGGCDLGSGFVWAPTHQNTIIGLNAGNNNTLTGTGNVALGYYALNANTNGVQNVAIGCQALQANSSGDQNVAIGYQALNQATASQDIAIGYQTLQKDTGSGGNIALGVLAMQNAAPVNGNDIAIGYGTLQKDTSPGSNIALGNFAMYNAATAGGGDIAIGTNALYNDNGPGRNIALGLSAMIDAAPTDGYDIAIGYNALLGDQGTGSNIAIGYAVMGNASPNDGYDIAIGSGTLNSDQGGYNIGIGTGALTSLVTGTNNIAIGVLSAAGAGSNYSGNESHNIVIGNLGQTGDQAVTRIGLFGPDFNPDGIYTSSCFIDGIYGVIPPAPDSFVIINSNGQLGSTSSTSFLSTLTTATSCDIPLTLVLRDSTGSFSATMVTLTGNTMVNYGTSSCNLTATPFIFAPLSQNTIIGVSANNNTPLAGSNNTAYGYHTLSHNLLGSDNTAIGNNALSLTTVNQNTAVGSGALQNNSTGIQNAALGYYALNLNTTGTSNTAIGYQTLIKNTTGTDNTAIGNNALNANTASQNTAVGSDALQKNTTGIQNVALGYQALNLNTTGTSNTAIGYQALASGIGNFNTAVGAQAGLDATGSSNTLIGNLAASNSSFSGSYNTIIGYGAGPNISTGQNNIYIGYNTGTSASSAESSTIRIGLGTIATNSCFIGGIYPNPLIGLPVVVTSNGQLGVGSSSDLINTATSCDIPLTLALRDSTGSFEATTITLTGNSLINYSTVGGCNTGSGFIWAPTNYNTIIGLGAGNNNTLTGTSNVAIGYEALSLNSTGSLNTAIGTLALYNNTTASRNAALGYQALYANQTATDCTALGYQALQNNTSSGITAVGSGALQNNPGVNNTAVGYQAGQSLIVSGGSDNTFVGYQAGSGLTGGSLNTIVGSGISFSNTSASNNVIVGGGTTNIPSTQNTIVGIQAGGTSMTSASANTLIGYIAGNALTSGSDNVIIGNSAGTSLTAGSNNIIIGQGAASGFNASDTIQIGIQGTQTSCYIAGIFGTSGGATANMVITTGGLIQQIISNRKFKDDIETLTDESDKLYQLTPVKFSFKTDQSKKMHYGFIAEDVAETVPELAQYDLDGNPIFIEFNDITALLVKEQQKDHVKVLEHEKTINELQLKIAELEEKIERLIRNS